MPELAVNCVTPTVITRVIIVVFGRAQRLMYERERKHAWFATATLSRPYGPYRVPGCIRELVVVIGSLE